LIVVNAASEAISTAVRPAAAATDQHACPLATPAAVARPARRPAVSVLRTVSAVSCGFTEVWREGDATVALSLPGTDVQLMLDANDPDAPVGPLFVVDSVKAFHATHPETLTVIDEPAEIPGGFLATYQDPGGVTIYVMDQSTDSASQ